MGWNTIRIYSQQFKWNGYRQFPRMKPLALLKWNIATRCPSFNRLYLRVIKPHWFISLHPVASIDGSNTVKHKIPVFSIAWQLNKKLYTAVLSHRTLILGVYGTQVQPMREKVHINGF